MKKLIFIYAIGMSVIMSACGHSETADLAADFTVKSDAIVQEFLDDEKTAGTKYIDKVLQVTGPVMEVNKTDGKILGVKISTDEFAIVNCTFQTSPENVPDGEITIKGVCSGFSGDAESMLPGGTVELNRGALVTE